ncbi:hypothetical protein D3C76_1846150 [compost metagenome]
MLRERFLYPQFHYTSASIVPVNHGIAGQPVPFHAEAPATGNGPLSTAPVVVPVP